MESMPSIAAEAVLVRTKKESKETLSEDSRSEDPRNEDTRSESSIMKYSSTEVEGYDFNEGINHRALLQTYLTTGFQATNFGLAIQQIQSMVNYQLIYFYLKTRFGFKSIHRMRN